MYKAGDKFIIEIADSYSANNEALNDIVKLYRIVGFNSLVFDERGLDRLTKYHIAPEAEASPEVTELGQLYPGDRFSLLGKPEVIYMKTGIAYHGLIMVVDVDTGETHCFEANVGIEVEAESEK